MKPISLIFALIFLTLNAKGQYPFEKYPAIKYREYKNWKFYDKTEKENKFHCTLTIPKFFDNQDNLTIRITTFGYSEGAFIRIYHNKKLLQKNSEPMFFNDLNIDNQSIRVADINGDSLKDIKIIAWYMGNGLAGLFGRTIYLFQNKEGHFTKVSFTNIAGNEVLERDFDGDGNYEIITMTLKGYGGHNYWLFNLFNYLNGDLVNVNSKDNYPIMIQYLNRDNYQITKKISRSKMKAFTMKLPEGYDKK
ncbi:hypothetical protein VB776_02295 [Arcicella sp. DC2W]|uniref:VCBS repeat-containing protein n=1 Tax=Arcicella gelida TaxID=2984195 RepID=A0ABU5RZR3_9BACT|nr:hypothetical protein [Arcicella sp. DC2W]MEA5401727.1 hypothetical protein [Arcicella sp. DC2W]